MARPSEYRDGSCGDFPTRKQRNVAFSTRLPQRTDWRALSIKLCQNSHLWYTNCLGSWQHMEDYFSSTEGYRIQKTLRGAATVRGIGLHTGAPCALTLYPAPPNHGIVFERRDLATPNRMLAHFDSVVATAMATTIGVAGEPDTRVGTVEHLMAALYALGITNVLAQVEGPEIPILDGSAHDFIQAVLDVGIEFQSFSNPVLRILKPVKVFRDGVVCELLPRERLRLTTSIDFPHPSIGLQTFALELTPGAFIEEVCAARTFGFLRDVERLRASQLALGASVENVLAFSDDGIANREGARFPDECVRHKLLDALGDLALIGCWIEGEMVSFRGGHSMHLALLEALQNHPSHWEIEPAEALGAARMSAERTRPVARTAVLRAIRP
ncbi:UDP-3-O-acyl-N-acetylglucosamine deacetylase [bacterium]|nr:UDP-3-O-acyl-N-acetylglucosamine deacetylase [bacterium]